MAEVTVRYCPRCLTTFGEDLGRCPNLGCTLNAPAEGWGTLLEVGAVFDRHYRVLQHLAVGGGGITYRARELDASGDETGPQVAIKVLYSGRDQGGFLKRLATEAQILQELDHPNIVELRGFVHRAGHPPYLITRFEEGGTLLDLVRRVGPLSPRVAAAIGRQIGWALHLAHDRGIVHRDLKPENVLLTSEVPVGAVPEIRVADFGIAKVQGGLGAQTREGAFVGTPAYAAPEQLAGAPPTPATDLYGLGALLYFCVTAGTLVDMAAPIPWEERSEDLIRRLPPRLPGSDAVTAHFNALLAATLAADPADRLSLEALDGLFIAALGSEEEANENGPAGETLAYALGGDLDRLLQPRPTWGTETAARLVRTRSAAHAAWTPPALTPVADAVPPSAFASEATPEVSPPATASTSKKSNLPAILLIVAGVGALLFLAVIAAGLGAWMLTR